MEKFNHNHLLTAAVMIPLGLAVTIGNSFGSEPGLSEQTIGQSSNVLSDNNADYEATTVSLSQYGPVKMGDTLSNIAYTLFPDGSLQLEQIMWSLYENNPDAFQKNDINRLKIGSVLKVPDIEKIQSLENSVARNKIRERSNNPPEDLSKIKAQIEKTRSDYAAQQNKQKLLKSQLIELENQVKMLLQQNSNVDSALNELNQQPAK